MPRTVCEYTVFEESSKSAIRIHSLTLRLQIPTKLLKRENSNRLLPTAHGYNLTR